MEKLAALSRLFGVPVGWLLGMERESTPDSGELSEAQLKLVEDITARYAAGRRLSPGRLAAARPGGAFGLDEGWKELTGLELDTSDTDPGGWMVEDGSFICG